MALSDTVKSSLRDAQENLRNALAFSARQEKPFISKNIADMLAQIENVIDASEVIDKIENIEAALDEKLNGKTEFKIENEEEYKTFKDKYNG